MATDTSSRLQTISTNQRNTAAVQATVPKDQPDGKKIVMTATGNASSTSFNVAHNLGVVPTAFFLEATSLAASAAHYITADATNLTVVFAAAPAAAANNVTYVGWAFL